MKDLITDNQELYSLLALRDDLLQEEGGEVPGDLQEKLKELMRVDKPGIAKTASQTNYLKFIKEYLKNEKKRIDLELKKVGRIEEFIKEKLKNKMLELGEKRLEGNSGHSASIRNSQAVEILNIDSIPEEYCFWEKSVDKMSIKNALKAGKVVPGAALKNNKSVVLK